jgi:hypothetical protein
MITVLEKVTLNSDHASSDGALLAGQAYDEVLHDNAHHADGYVDHAAFMYQEPDKLIILYPWRDETSIRELLAQEERLLTRFFSDYCIGRREVTILTELPVEV